MEGGDPPVLVAHHSLEGCAYEPVVNVQVVAKEAVPLVEEDENTDEGGDASDVSIEVANG